MKPNPPVKKNDDLTLTIDAITSEGQGIGRVDGYAVFVPGALAGETVQAHIIKVTANYAVAKLIKVRREGKTMVYSLADEHVKTILQMGLEHVLE